MVSGVPGKVPQSRAISGFLERILTATLLRRHYEGQDMSDLLNRLLKEWVKRHQSKS
jgi:hypothetical protein